MKRVQKITKGMTVGEVIKKYPKTAVVFMKHGLHCIGCPLAQNDTLESAAKLHNINLKKLLEDLNEQVKK